MKCLICSLLLITVIAIPAQSQEQSERWSKPMMNVGNQMKTVNPDSTYRSPKRPGHYTTKDWRALIDSLWGPGLPTSTKLEVFDTFWNAIDRYYAGFPHLTVNWDSLKSRYRPEIERGVSRGRLWGIMSQLYLATSEIHTYMIDAGLDSSYVDNGKLVYRPGLPVFFLSGWGLAGNFGAGLTPLPDSSLLVYRALSPHPLGLVPGDIVLGYDGVPWKHLYKELLAAELPFEWWGESRFGSSPRSMTHALLNSAGNNWGLFDTLDVLKYATGDTVHFPTSLLTGLDWGSLFATEQVVVPGVPMPNFVGGERVAWGVVQNTSIGYVYAYSWEEAVRTPFARAIGQIAALQKVSGLILDFRYNIGGTNSANAGLDLLFNHDPTDGTRWRHALRTDPSNHSGFSYSSQDFSFYVTPDYFDRPIAVLIGPQAWSYGDLVPFMMRSHPMVRFFGRPTNGAYVSPGSYVSGGPLWGNWYYNVSNGQMESLVNNEGFLMHNSFPVDEEVWLTRDGVAQGKDDVVERALAWISTLSYAHDVHLSQPTRDTVRVTARVENPLSHLLAMVATLRDGSGGLMDSLALKDDGQHGDGMAGDSLWGSLYVPPTDAVIHASVRADDLTTGTSRMLSDAAQLVFTRNALITLDARTIDLGRININRVRFDTSFVVHNIGFASDSITITVDPGNVTPEAAIAANPASIFLAAGDSERVTFSIYPQLLASAYYSAAIMVEPKTGAAQGQLTKTYLFQIVLTSVPEDSQTPSEFALWQCYPNPFNPSTTIKYELPKLSDVKLSVFDLLGREVAVLLNGRMDAGYHQLQFDASKLASGVYLYRMQAGDFVQTRKLLLIK